VEERIQKVLARAGVASRREAERLISEGRVAVNGRVIHEFGVKVDPRMDEIRVDTLLVSSSAAAADSDRVYLLLNKPKGVLCTVKDTHGRPTVLDLVPPRAGRRLYPVGRLDEDSEGLVLMTNDGELTARLTHPRYAVPKTYDVRVKGRLTPEHAREFEAGVWLSEGKTGRSRVAILKPGFEVTHVAVTLHEGRNREIRRAFEKLGFPVLSVKRIQIGPIVSRGLRPGSYRPLDAEEIAELRAVAEGRAVATPARRRRPGGEDAPPRRKRRPGKPDPAKLPRRDTRGDRGGRSGRQRPAKPTRGGGRRR
jgi:23S rRNA pseudouridine2605 synthase